MGLYISPNHSIGIFSIGKQTLRRAVLWLTSLMLVATSIAHIPVPQAHADYNTFAQTPTSSIGKRAGYYAPQTAALAVDSAGNTYNPSTGVERGFIRVLSPTGAFVRDITPYEPNVAYGSGYSTPVISYVTVDDAGDIYAVIRDNTIEKYTSSGTFIRSIGSAGSGNGQFNNIGQLTTDHLGNLYAIDTGNSRIQKFNSSGTYLSQFGGPGSANGQFSQMTDLEVDSGNNLYVADSDNHRVQKFNSSGTFLLKYGKQEAAFACPSFPEFDNIQSIAIDASDNAYVTARSGSILCNVDVQKFDSSGNYLGNLVDIATHPNRMKLARGTNIFYSQEYRTRETIARYDLSGNAIDIIGMRTDPGNFTIPGGMVRDSSGNTYVTDTVNYRVQKFDQNGVYVTSFGSYGSGNGQFRDIGTIAINSADKIYVGDTNNGNIQTFTTAGTYIATISAQGGDNMFIDSHDDLILNTSNSIQFYGSDNVLKQTLTGYQRNGATINFSYVPEFAVMHNDVLVFREYSGNKYIRISYDGQFIDELSTTLTGSSPSHRLYPFYSPSKLVVDHNDILYVNGIEANSPSTSLLQRPILAALNFDAQPSEPNFRFVKTIDDVWESSIYFGQDNTLYEVSGKFDYVGVYPVASTVLASSAPQNLVATSPSNGTVTATWDAPQTDNGSPVTGYRVEYKANSASSWTFHSFVTNPTVTIVPLATDSYDVRIVAVNEAGRSLPVTQTALAVQGITLPSAPQNVVATSPSRGNLSVSWNAPTDAGGGSISSYSVEYKPHDYNQWIQTDTTAATTMSITGLTDGLYDVRVKATNSTGSGPVATDVDTTVSATYGYKSLIATHDDSWVQGMVFDSTGARYDIDYYYDKIDVYAADGTYERSFGSSGEDPGQLYSARNLAISSDGKLYIADYGNSRISIFNTDGTYVSSFGTYGSGDGEMEYPTQVYLDEDDNAYVVSEYSNIQKYDKNGNFISRIATEASSPTAMTMDSSGNMYVANSSYDSEHGIFKYNSAGIKTATIGSEGESDGQFYDIYSMLINTDGNLVVNDAYNGRIQVFSTDGQHLGSIGRGYGDEGEFLTFDDSISMAQASNGDLYVANAYSPYIQTFNYVGEGSATPPAATPSTPQSVSVDATTANQAAVTWTPPVDDGGNAISQYTLEYKLTSASTWTTATIPSPTTTHTLENLAAGQYEVRVSATNTTGAGSASTPVAFTVSDPSTPLTAPTSPQTVSATSPAPNSIMVDWQNPANDGGSTVTGYSLEYRLSGGDWSSVNIDASTTRHTLLDIPAGSYDIRISAINAVGASTPSSLLTIEVPTAVTKNPVTVTSQPSVNATVQVQQTTVEPAPSEAAAPTPAPSVTATPAYSEDKPGEVVVSWQPPSTTPPSSYIIEYRDASIPESDTTTPWKQLTEVTPDHHSALITLPNGSYVVRVAAVMPGEAKNRIILGVARVVITPASIQGDGPSVTGIPATPTSANNTVRNVIAGCGASVMVASLFIIPIFWRKRRKKAQVSTVQQQPSRRQ